MKRYTPRISACRTVKFSHVYKLARATAVSYLELALIAINVLITSAFERELSGGFQF